MFGREDEMTQSAVREEREREQARDEYMKGFEQPPEPQEDPALEEQRREEEKRQLEERLRRSPPPTVQLNGFADGALDGEDMFKNIGR